MDIAQVASVPRLNELKDWVDQCLPGASATLQPASGDASFRRYFRITHEGQSRVVMDAPPPQENCEPFVRIAALLAAAGMHVPQVLHQDLARGFLILTDLGSHHYLDAFRAGSDPNPLIHAALSALVSLQANTPCALPPYDEALLRREMALFPDWFVECQLGTPFTPVQRQVFDQAQDLLLANILAQPQVAVHRDYHCRNLMVCSPLPGVLDFQDAVWGPMTYDAVSLLKDAYWVWQEEQRLDWLIRHWEALRHAGLPAPDDFSRFYRDFEWMGVQRHLKVVGIFARLCHRDGKEAYLKDIPLVWKYLRETCLRYDELAPLRDLLDQLQPVNTTTGYSF
jgi:aminoglycoside/choline kinase family phosphotransferase